jgi:hypothetical protein
MTDTASPDLGPIDLAPFFERYDRKNRLVFVAAISASLTMSAVMFAHGPPAAGWIHPQAAETARWFGILFAPVFLAGWYVFGALMAHGRRKSRSPVGPLPTSEDDARNGVRVANAGFVWNLILTATMIVQQALWLPFVFGYRVAAGVLIARAIMLTVGAATIYLGNLWPRMPAPRAPGRTAAIRMKVNRISGWVMVVFGLLVILLGLFLPLLVPGLRHPA